MGDSVTHRPFLRLNIRKKRAGVKRDLFEALLERSCMLRFAHFLSKAEDRCLASLNFWLEARKYSLSVFEPSVVCTCECVLYRRSFYVIYVLVKHIEEAIVCLF